MGPETTDINKSPRMRPRIERELSVPLDGVLSRVRESLAEQDCRCTGTVLGKHLELYIKPEHRHFWSPWFSGEVDESGAGRAVLHGRFGPHPAIWTGFAACYAVCIFSAISALIFGASQWMLGRPPWALWIAPAFLLAVMAVYVLARLGRGLATEQIGWMLQLLDCSLDGELLCAKARCIACPQWTAEEHANAHATVATQSSGPLLGLQEAEEQLQI